VRDYPKTQGSPTAGKQRVLLLVTHDRLPAALPAWLEVDLAPGSGFEIAEDLVRTDEEFRFHAKWALFWFAKHWPADRFKVTVRPTPYGPRQRLGTIAGGSGSLALALALAGLGLGRDTTGIAASGVVADGDGWVSAYRTSCESYALKAETAARLGYHTFIVPRRAIPMTAASSAMRVVEVDCLDDLLSALTAPASVKTQTPSSPPRQRVPARPSSPSLPEIRVLSRTGPEVPVSVILTVKRSNVFPTENYYVLEGELLKKDYGEASVEDMARIASEVSARSRREVPGIGCQPELVDVKKL